VRASLNGICYWLPWLVLLSLVIPCFALLSGILGMPLSDGLYARMDEAMGFNVPAIVSCAATHPTVNALLNQSYDLLPWMLLVALLVAVCGDRERAKRFLIAIAVSEALAFPLFVLFPAIGPWAAYGFAPNASQQFCEASMLALRNGGHAGTAGIVCFPSFHVIWALFSAWALWRVKLLRVPACVLAFLIIVSTVTTGWHYGVDVLAGIFLARFSLCYAESLKTMAAFEQRKEVSDLIASLPTNVRAMRPNPSITRP
jgi:hypothetical protein